MNERKAASMTVGPIPASQSPSPSAQDLEDRIAELEARLDASDPVRIFTRVLAEIEREREKQQLVRPTAKRSATPCPEKQPRNEYSAHTPTMGNGESSTSDLWAEEEANEFIKTIQRRKRQRP